MTTLRHCEELTAVAPFDFDKSLAFIERFPPTAGEQDTSARLVKALRVAGETVGVKIQTGRAKNRLACTLHTRTPLHDEARAKVIDRVRFMLSLDDDLREFYATAAEDAPFAPIAARLRGHHHVKFPSPFEIAAWSVLAQRTRIAGARAVKRAITERFGDAIEIDGAAHRAFPDAQTIDDAGEDALAEVVRHPVKCQRVAAIARAFREVDERFLREGDYDEVESWLRALPGIGPWSSAFVLFRGLGRMDRMEVTPGPIAECAKRVYGPRLSDREALARSARYGRFRGYWALYLRIAA